MQWWCQHTCNRYSMLHRVNNKAGANAGSSAQPQGSRLLLRLCLVAECHVYLSHIQGHNLGLAAQQVSQAGPGAPQVACSGVQWIARVSGCKLAAARTARRAAQCLQGSRQHFNVGRPVVSHRSPNRYGKQAHRSHPPGCTCPVHHSRTSHHALLRSAHHINPAATKAPTHRAQTP